MTQYLDKQGLTKVVTKVKELVKTGDDNLSNEMKKYLSRRGGNMEEGAIVTFKSSVSSDDLTAIDHVDHLTISGSSISFVSTKDNDGLGHSFMTSSEVTSPHVIVHDISTDNINPNTLEDQTISVGGAGLNAKKFVKTDGTNQQVLLADGTVATLGSSANCIPQFSEQGVLNINSISLSKYNSDLSISAKVLANGFKLSYGKATDVLTADGGIKMLGAANGIASLDENGRVPLSQLGNLDTTVAEVVTALPTTGIKKHIYMVKSDASTTQNIYKEYLYMGDVSAAYDASKWEELGEYKADIDLSPYAKKSEALRFVRYDKKASTDYAIALSASYADGDQTSTTMIAAATTELAGAMSATDKTKLDGIASNATSDSAIPDSEIEALFA